jgi:Protein of unknown function (DUF1566)
VRSSLSRSSRLRRRLVFIAIAAAASAGALLALACNQVAGLDGFREVDCFQAPCVDASTADVVVEARADAPDGFVPDAGPIVDAGVFEHQTWAHWKMPNPDAGGVVPGPNPMKLDAGPDPSSPTDTILSDLVTGLQWRAKVEPAAQIGEALNRCAKPGNWRVPTRIELVTLIDFTRKDPALHEVFFRANVDKYGGSSGNLRQFWSASSVAGAKGTYWSVNFETGKVDPANGNVVRCVRGGPAK